MLTVLDVDQPGSVVGVSVCPVIVVAPASPVLSKSVTNVIVGMPLFSALPPIAKNISYIERCKSLKYANISGSFCIALGMRVGGGESIGIFFLYFVMFMCNPIKMTESEYRKRVLIRLEFIAYAACFIAGLVGWQSIQSMVF